MTKKTSTSRKKTGASKETPSFEEALENLEAIIDRIESGEIPLEQSIQEYEKGMKLIKQCREFLEKAEQRVSELSLDDGATKED